MSDVRNQSQSGLDAVKASSERVADAFEEATQKIIGIVGQIKSTNNAEQTVTAKPAPMALYEGLKGVVTSVNRIADQVLSHPNEIKSTMESATTVCRQFTDLVDHASRTAETVGDLRKAASEATETSRWIDSNFTGGRDVPVVNALGRVCDF